MIKKCRQCTRVNPAEASYCYFDGAGLDGAGRDGPINWGTLPFAAPFVFPSGAVCRNFDQLALACQSDWPAALRALRQGFLASFLGGVVGRADLAETARNAAHSPDPDLGLEQFLRRLPSQVLAPPKLHVEPREINLGMLRPGADVGFELCLENQGMHLLQGAVSSADGGWLNVGQAPGARAKPFRCLGQVTLPVRVRSQALRAGNQPLEAHLTITSNGGEATVIVRAEVPVCPFPTGVLAGAASPRQLAEKARAAPAQAAVLIEQGAVAHWYKENGWSYPVRGPSASGLAAVQQFFEALGLTPPPHVGLRESAVALQGRVGDPVHHDLEVVAQEHRPVYATATSDQPWLHVSGTRLHGRVATIGLTVPAVPDRPGETLQAQVTITANGNQRFLVPVALAVDGARTALSADQPPGQPRRVVPPADFPVAIPVAEAFAPSPPEPATSSRIPPAPPTARPFFSPKWPAWVHLVPVCLVALALLGTIVRDAFLTATPEAPDEEELLDPTPRIGIRFHDHGDNVVAAPTMSFGLVMLGVKDPHDPAQLKRLTYDEWGRSNNACVRIDGVEQLLGDAPGNWATLKAPLGVNAGGRTREGTRSIWQCGIPPVTITQVVELVPGAQSRLLDTCLVRYRIQNEDRVAHAVGLRFLLDTYIGANDGVPFTIPGEKDLCDTMHEFNSPAAVPDFIQALEREDLEHPGTIAQLQLRLGGQLESPERVTLGAWPNAKLARLTGDDRARSYRTGWEVPVLPMKTLTPADSTVVMYWNDRPLAPGAVRKVGFAYGLGSLASAEGQGQLAVTVGGSFVPGGEFTVTAYVKDPVAGQTVRLDLPPALQLIAGEASQTVPLLAPGASSRNSPVTWRVRVTGEPGRYSLQVTSSTGAAQSQDVTIRSNRIFD